LISTFSVQFSGSEGPSLFFEDGNTFWDKDDRNEPQRHRAWVIHEVERHTSSVSKRHSVGSQYHPRKPGTYPGTKVVDFSPDEGSKEHVVLGFEMNTSELVVEAIPPPETNMSSSQPHAAMQEICWLR
jgi:hypothetical protein